MEENNEIDYKLLFGNLFNLVRNTALCSDEELFEELKFNGIPKEVIKEFITTKKLLYK